MGNAKFDFGILLTTCRCFIYYFSRELAGIQNGLVGCVDDFLNTTITITAADATALRARAEV